MSDCPLCYGDRVTPIGIYHHRDYYCCEQCDLIFMGSACLPTREVERAIYDGHNNQSDDHGYQNFLSRLAKPLGRRLSAQSQGLDFGCGPGPTLHKLFEEQGHQMQCYDPIYSPGTSLLEQTYDFVTSSEVIEHFHNPAESWALLLQLVAPGGWLGIMTKRHLGPKRFSSWHYKNDPTHVVFYSEASLIWLANRWHLQIEFPAADVALMKKL